MWKNVELRLKSVSVPDGKNFNMGGFIKEDIYTIKLKSHLGQVSAVITKKITLTVD